MRKIVLSEENVIKILYMYNNDLLGSQTISERLGINKHIVLRTLKENGVNLGPSGRRFIGGRKEAIKRYQSKPETKIRKSKNYKNWYEKNKERLKTYTNEYRKKNAERIRKNKRIYEKTRKSNDPIYKLINNFRTAIYQVLKENNVKKNGHYFEILKYNPEELISHLENQFTEGMTWENYGQWHVDHIRPISSFKINQIGDNEFMECWSLKNLQPLWGDENIRKSNKTNYL